MKDRTQNITIKIADVAPIGLTIQPDTEEIVRNAERQVNMLWAKWRKEFEKMSSKEVLAMVAYQFANRYYKLLDTVNEREEVLSAFEAELDRLLEIGGNPQSPVHRDIVD